MKSKTKNQLEELADRFAKGNATVKDIDAAGRIVAELAKVTWLEAEPSWDAFAREGAMPNMIGLARIVNNCRAIAEKI